MSHVACIHLLAAFLAVQQTMPVLACFRPALACLPTYLPAPCLLCRPGGSSLQDIVHGLRQELQERDLQLMQARRRMQATVPRLLSVHICASGLLTPQLGQWRSAVLAPRRPRGSPAALAVLHA